MHGKICVHFNYSMISVKRTWHEWGWKNDCLWNSQVGDRSQQFAMETLFVFASQMCLPRDWQGETWQGNQWDRSSKHYLYIWNEWPVLAAYFQLFIRFAWKYEYFWWEEESFDDLIRSRWAYKSTSFLWYNSWSSAVEIEAFRPQGRISYLMIRWSNYFW